MKKLLFILLLISGVASAQYNPTGSKMRFVNGIGLGTKDTTGWTGADTLVMIIGKDSIPYFRYKGYWKPFSIGSSGTFKSAVDSLYNSGYARRDRVKQGLDSLGVVIGAGLYTKINISDTSAMLSPYQKAFSAVKYGDTSGMLLPYSRLQFVNAQLSNKVNVSDTASMLLPYYRSNVANAALALKLNISDTASMLNPYQRSFSAVKYSDTSSMLNAYKLGIIALNADTATLGARFSNQTSLANSKLAIGDTASMLSPYAKTISLGGYVPYTGATSDLNLGSRNLYVNNVFDGFSSIAASGTQVVLTIASVPSYLVTGSGGQTIKLPNATTLSNGAIYVFNNNQSSGAISINNNSNTLVKSVPSGAYLTLELIDNSTAAGSWDGHFQSPSNVSWSTNTFDYAGSITSATWNGATIAINRGGTGATTAASALSNLGGLAISDTATMLGGYKTYYPRAAISAGTGITYNSTTGVITNSSPSSGGTVTSVATNNGSGITGGTITGSGTLAIDTVIIASRLRVQKGIDSLGNVITSGLALKLNISDTASMLSTYARTAALSNYLPLSGGTLTGALNGTSASFTSSGRFDGTLLANSSTASTSATTGALVVTGGLGISGSTYVRGNFVTNDILMRNATSLNFYNQGGTLVGSFSHTTGFLTLNYGLAAPSANFNSSGTFLISQPTSVGSAQYQAWNNSAGTRRGYFGYGSASVDLLSLVNETGGGLYFGGGATFSSDGTFGFGVGGSTNTILTINGGSSAIAYLKFTTGSTLNSQISSFGNALYFGTNGATTALTLASTGAATFSSSATASSFIKSGGTSSQYLMADGSVTTGGGGGISGSGVANQLTYWSGTSAVQGSTTLTYNTSGNVGMTISPSLLAASAIARGVNITSTLTAAANSDVLVGADFTPTFVNGSFTGVQNFAIRTNNSGINTTYSGVTSGVTPFGLALSNTTAATSGNVQSSPYLLFLGNNFFSTSRTDSIRIYNSVSGTQGSLVIDQNKITDLTQKQNIFQVKQSTAGTGGDLSFINSISSSVNTNALNFATQYRILTPLTIDAGSLVVNNSGAAAAPRGTSFFDVTGQGNMNSLTINTAGVLTASSILTVSSTTQGFLQPRMTTTQRDAISSPATGLQVYNTTTNTNDYYNGSAWTSQVTNSYSLKSANYTLVPTDDYINVSATATMTLPTAVGIAGKRFTITHVGTISNTITITTTSSQTFINYDGGASTIVLAAGQSKTVVSNGANWFVII